MNITIKAILMGVLEGLTEFIPVSSTGHLVLFGHWLRFTGPGSETFGIAIQLGAILAVVVLYRKRFLTFIRPAEWFKPNTLKIVIATVPALITGLLLYQLIKTHLFTPVTVLFGLGIGGVLMMGVDRVKPCARTDSLDAVTFKQAAWIGVAQCTALWPGVSRSGATLVGGLLCGLSYSMAAEFSFLVAVPVMMAAVGYEMFKSAGTITAHDLQLIAIGFVVAFVVSLIAVKTFIQWLSRIKLAPFGAYRVFLALVIGGLMVAEATGHIHFRTGLLQ